MFFEDVKNAVDKNDWKTLGRDKKGRFTPRGGDDETKKPEPAAKKPVNKTEPKPTKKPVSKKTKEKDTTAKKEETKKLVKKVKSSCKKNKGSKRNEEERDINPIPKKNEIGTTMCDYLSKFHK